MYGAGAVAKQAKPPSSGPASHMGSNFCLCFSTSDPLPCLYLGEAEPLSNVALATTVCQLYSPHFSNQLYLSLPNFWFSHKACSNRLYLLLFFPPSLSSSSN